MKPEPYTGKEPYIFISYAHKNKNAVLPIVSQLYKNDYRVWYDEGIDPGTEWDNNIAGHIKACDFFIAFLSIAYMESDNCKDELNFARDKNKNRLIIYLEEAEIDDGMQMRLNRLQAIFKYTYANEDDFYKKLFSTQGIAVCKNSMPDDDKENLQEVVCALKPADTNEAAMVSWSAAGTEPAKIAEPTFPEYASKKVIKSREETCAQIVQQTIVKINETNSIYKFLSCDTLKREEILFLTDILSWVKVEETPMAVCTLDESISDSACVLTDSYMLLYKRDIYQQRYCTLPLKNILKQQEEWNGTLIIQFMDHTKMVIKESDYKSLIEKFINIFLENSGFVDEYYERKRIEDAQRKLEQQRKQKERDQQDLEILSDAIEATNKRTKKLKILCDGSSRYAKIVMNNQSDKIFFDKDFVYGFGIKDKLPLRDLKAVAPGDFPGWIDITLENGSILNLTFGFEYTCDMSIFFEEYLKYRTNQ